MHQTYVSQLRCANHNGKEPRILNSCGNSAILLGMDSIGIDIVEISRIREALSRFGERFLNRIYTESEIKLYREKLPSLAARFAAKEAVAKALKTKSLTWHDIEVLSDPQGKPVCFLHGKAERRARRLGFGRIMLTISHSRNHAVAFVIIRRVRRKPHQNK